MFPQSYYPARMFAPRYWPKTADDVQAIPGPFTLAATTVFVPGPASTTEFVPGASAQAAFNIGPAALAAKQ